MGKTVSWRGKAILILLVSAGAAALWLTGLHEYLSFETIKENRNVLRSYVDAHYVLSAISFMAAVVSTAFFLPGAIAMTLVGGFLFGVVMGTVYLLAGATMGAALAFLASRYVIGNWLQHRYEQYLKAFNDEISRHGRNYLIVLRLVPVMPFFLVNYLAGITSMTLGTFVWTTAAGMLPGSLAYTFAGRELGNIESAGDIISPRLIFALLLLAFFALLPMFVRLYRWIRNRKT